jgi:hypothetical protein
VAVFTAFSDESGTGDIEGVYLVGGYVAPENAWGDFANLWHDIVLKAPPSIPYLHMREIRRDVFQAKHKLTISDAEAKVETATNLLHSIADSHPGKPRLYAVLSVIHRSDLWDRVKLMEDATVTVAKGTMDVPDYLCFLGYAQTVLHYTSEMFQGAEKVDFVVSKNGKITEHFKTYANGLRGRSPLMGELIAATPEDRNPLQMADVLCWHTRRYHEYGTIDANFQRLASCRCFKHLWRRAELEGFTQSLIGRVVKT